MEASIEFLTALIHAPGPPAQEGPVRDVLTQALDTAGIKWTVDARGNLLASPGNNIPEKPRIVVTAHMDEIALMVRQINPDGTLSVLPLGGAHPWKWGEGPVDILCGDTPLQGVLSFGSIHTTDASTAIQKSRDGKAIAWSDAKVITGIPADQLPDALRSGTRIVLSKERRTPVRLGMNAELIAAPFLDDRADCVVWLQTLLALKEAGACPDVLFAATTAEELGGHGALWLLGGTRPDICIALEIAPIAPDNDLRLNATPTCWSTDGYSPTAPSDLDLVAAAAEAAGTGVSFHALTRGGSDASCAAASGHCARPITLALPVDNTHGFEVMHIGAIGALTQLTTALLKTI
jgi:putative aminopeptidase FrvX